MYNTKIVINDSNYEELQELLFEISLEEVNWEFTQAFEELEAFEEN